MFWHWWSAGGVFQSAEQLGVGAQGVVSLMTLELAIKQVQHQMWL